MNSVDAALIDAIAHEAGEYVRANSWYGWDVLDGPGARFCAWRITSEHADSITVYFYNGTAFVHWQLDLDSAMPTDVAKATALAAIQAQDALR